MSDKSSINLVTLQKSIQQSLKKPQAKEACLSFQYKLILLHSSKLGIYILPQLDTLNIWHGVVFMRYGLYKDGKLKFKINFDNFPRMPPKVIFISKVYHPLINMESGQLDLGQQINKNWNYGNQHLILTVIQHIKLVFADVKKYQVDNSYNKKAGQTFKNNVDQFFIKVRESVQNSKNQLYNNYAQTSLKFTPFTQRHRKIRQQLSLISQDQTLTQEQKKKKFLKSLKQ